MEFPVERSGKMGEKVKPKTKLPKRLEFGRSHFVEY